MKKQESASKPRKSIVEKILDKKQISEINCIAGVCGHSVNNKECLYWKICDSDDPGDTMKKYILKVVAEACTITKNNRDTITTNKIKERKQCKKTTSPQKSKVK